MEGCRLIFSTIASRTYGGKLISEWLIDEARKLQIDGVTVIDAKQGYGRDKKLHSSSFFELAEQPIEVIMVASAQKCATILDILKKEEISIFYVKYPVEFGFTF